MNKRHVKHDGKIEKKGLFTKKWRVDPITVKAADENEVVWSSTETDFVVWFPPDWSPLVGLNQSGKTREFRATVKDTVKPGTSYPYSIFCYHDYEMTESNSSPEMIIE
jgi:hypothetical protein